MKTKKILGFTLALITCFLAVATTWFSSVAKAENTDTADQIFIEALLQDSNYTGEVDYTYSPLYNQNLQVSGRNYTFSLGDITGFALVAEIYSGNTGFYEVEEIKYNSSNPFENCQGLPVYVTHNLYLDFVNGAFYNLSNNQTLSAQTVAEKAEIGFAYRSTDWTFQDVYQQISYSSKAITSYYSITYDLPSYFGAEGTVCASTAGSVAIGYYDRFFENLIPNFQAYIMFGTVVRYKSISAEIVNLSTELYSLMSGGQQDVGVTFTQFQNGMTQYVANKGYNYSTTSVMSWGSFDFNKYKTAVESNKPVGIFLHDFALRDSITSENNVDTIENSYCNISHVVVGCGYEIHTYYNANGQVIDTRTYLKVASGLNSHMICYLNINSISQINNAIAITVS